MGILRGNRRLWRNIDQIPQDTDNYNGPDGIKYGVWNRFNTVIQCMF